MTYHGPGQVVVYPIVRLERFREVVPVVSAMEALRLRPARATGSRRRVGKSTVACMSSENQICAIGISVRQMTTMHGLAFNVSTDLDYDRLITPCGIRERGMTSLERELGRPVHFDEAKTVLLECLASEFKVTFRPSNSAPLCGAYAQDDKPLRGAYAQGDNQDDDRRDESGQDDDRQNDVAVAAAL